MGRPLLSFIIVISIINNTLASPLPSGEAQVYVAVFAQLPGIGDGRFERLFAGR